MFLPTSIPFIHARKVAVATDGGDWLKPSSFAAAPASRNVQSGDRAASHNPDWTTTRRILISIKKPLTGNG
jgi:hypothetical protein